MAGPLEVGHAAEPTDESLDDGVVVLAVRRRRHGAVAPSLLLGRFDWLFGEDVTARD